MPAEGSAAKTPSFEPFQDRLSRDIRNDLSESLLETLKQGSLAPAQAVAGKYRALPVPAAHLRYINDRLARYARALHILAAEKNAGAFARALVLWDLDLFFEVHEVLEQAWLKAGGEEKAVLQALIRAAGFYVKNEFGYRQGAARMAAKAVAALEEHRQAVPAGFPLDRLLDKLRALDPVPPKLLDLDP